MVILKIILVFLLFYHNTLIILNFPQAGVGEGLAEQKAAAGIPPGGKFASAPMAPVPGIREEGNVYRPVQDSGHERPFTYMDRVNERKQVEEVCG